MQNGSSSTERIKVADYLFTRLLQLGVDSIFGVPGDYNLRLLDFVEPAGVHWVGTCNELNAAYATDAYARIKGFGATITTFGVGELSAINGVANAFAERAPLAHIVGTPDRPVQTARKKVHHTFNDGVYDHFAKAFVHVTCAQTNLTDPRTVPEQIDWALEQALIHSRPVYIQVPNDMPDVYVSASRLHTIKITIPSAPAPPYESTLLSRILERVRTAARPMILVDGECRTVEMRQHIDSFVRTTRWPTWISGFGKGLVNEDLPNFYGVYEAGFGPKEWQAYFESSDLVLNFGPHHSTTNSAGGAAVPRPEVNIQFSRQTIVLGDETFLDLSKDFLPNLLQGMETLKISSIEALLKKDSTTPQLEKTGPLTQDHFWSVASSILRPGDILLGETGTSNYGTRHMPLPPHCRYFCAVTWLSIGYMLPATLGAAIAQRELYSAENTDGNGASKPKAVLFIGDGSLQMTVQEISTMIKEKLDIVIFVVNNDGYTIERVIHGRNEKYNDIAPWRYLQALSFFGASEEHVAKSTYSAKTWGELDEVLEDKWLVDGSGVRMAEVFMGRLDCTGMLMALLDKQKAAEEREKAGGEK